MPTIRIEKTKNYTVMSNQHLRDKKLSLKAKGLLSYMLSQPEDWDYTIEGLSKTSTDGTTSIRSTLKELQNNRYLEVEKIRNKKGIYESIYTIYEMPQKKKSCLNEPELIFHTGQSNVDNQRQLNTIKKILKKDKKKESPKSAYNNYEQRKYTKEELEKICKN